ncbi:MAG: dihydropteroate synthase, partial [Salinisphaera sp.]|nr:dihydropteroate synthase [Salinisphaera sp.]
MRCADRYLDLSRPRIMGVLNVTPDSFSDGGRYPTCEAAVRHALLMLEEGAGIIDVGGASTRPGAEPVPEQLELERVLPVLESLRGETDAILSIDTSSPEVMRAACAAGAELINDVCALRAPGALEEAAATGASVCLMHMQGEPRSMQKHPVYANVVAEVRQFLTERVAACQGAGIDANRILVDPGFGFRKNLAHNLRLLRDLGVIAGIGPPVLVGLSRKSMFPQLLGSVSVDERLP